MYEKIIKGLENDSNLYYKIKDREEAEQIADKLIENDYLLLKNDFVELFDTGRDCLFLFSYELYVWEYFLNNEELVLSVGKKEYKHIETIINPTYDDLLPLFSDTDSDDSDEVCSKPEDGGEKMKKDLIEIVATDDAYYVRCVYEVLKEQLADIDSHAWFVFDEVYELQDWNYDGFKKIYEYTKSDKEELLLNIKHIISISKLHEGDDED